MMVIAKDAEKFLIEDLRFCWEKSPTQRCLLLRFSKLSGDRDIWFADLMDSLKAGLIDDVNRVYICHDNDVFILSRSITNKRLEEFLAHLSPKLPPALFASSLGELAGLFEIGIHWAQLDSICRRKADDFAALQNMRALKKQEELETVTMKQAVSNIDQNLINSLQSRRNKRKEPEIMVVEDDLFSQKLINVALDKSYKLSLSADGHGAIMTYVSKAPDVLFLDIVLPDIDGHAVLEKIFSIDPNAYVVMFSGNGDKENIMRAMQLGAKGFVGKPFTKEKLFNYIDRSPFIQAKKKESFHGNLVH